MTTFSLMYEITHNLTSYLYHVHGLAVGTEYGILDYSQDNVEYLASLFGTSDDLPGSFNYYNFVINDFLPQRIGVYDISESSHNYSLNFQYNYYLADYESIAAQVHESHLPSHYILKHHNLMDNASQYGFNYGDDINEFAAASLSSLNWAINPSMYVFNYMTLVDYTTNPTYLSYFAYDPDNYYNLYTSKIQEYMQTQDYQDFKDKSRKCFMSFNRSVEKSTAPFYSKITENQHNQLIILYFGKE